MHGMVARDETRAQNGSVNRVKSASSGTVQRRRGPRVYNAYCRGFRLEGKEGNCPIDLNGNAGGGDAAAPRGRPRS